MEYIINKELIDKIKEEFPVMDWKNQNSKDEYNKLKEYFIARMMEFNEISSFEKMKNDESIDNYDFFNNLLEYGSISLDISDKDEYLKDTFDGNYGLQVLKTDVPRVKLNIKSNDDMVLFYVLLGEFAVKDGVEVFENHVYSLEEIEVLENQNLIRFLAKGDTYKRIDNFEYAKLSRKYNKKNIETLDFDSINKRNYLNLLNSYPYLFEFIRNRLTFEMFSNLLLSFEQSLTDTINNEMYKCDQVIKRYDERLENIKRLNKHL